MELNYTQEVNPQTGETFGPEKPTLLYRYPTMTPADIAIIVFVVFIIAIFGVLINIVIQNSKLRVRTITSVKRS